MVKKFLITALLFVGLLSSCGTMDDVYVTSYPWYWNRPYYQTDWYHPTPPPMIIFHKSNSNRNHGSQPRGHK